MKSNQVRGSIPIQIERRSFAAYALSETGTYIPLAYEQTACPFPDRNNETKQHPGPRNGPVIGAICYRS